LCLKKRNCGIEASRGHGAEICQAHPARQKIAFPMLANVPTGFSAILIFDMVIALQLLSAVV
jgi:hypothetical protein